MRNLNPLMDQGVEKGSTAVKAAPGAVPAAINLLTPQPLEQPCVTDGAKKTPAKRRRSLLLDPAVIVTGITLLLVGELVLWAAVGWLWWAVINMGIALVVAAGVLAWRRRTPGGLDRLLGGRSRPGRTSKTTTRTTTRGAGVPGRGVLSRLLPGRGRGTASPSGGGRGGGRPRGVLGGLLPGGGGRSAGRPAGGRSSTGRPGRSPGGGWWPFAGGGRGKSSSPRNPKKGNGNGKKSNGSSVLGDIVHGLTTPAPGRKPSPGPAATAAKKETERKESEPMTVRHDDDASLQRWGRNLKTISPAIEELLQAARQQDELAEAIASGVSKLAVQGESELPADRALVAEAEAIAAELRELMTDDRAGRLARLRDRADELVRSYGRLHEVDEARLAGERGGRAREKRADVAAAESDT